MTREEAIQKARRFLDCCYESWSGAKYVISEDECEAIEFLIEELKNKE